MTDKMLAEIAKSIDTYTEMALICHSRPDGDTIGSAFALKYAYPEKDIRIICEDEIPQRLSFICDGSKTDIPKKDYSVIVSIDCAATSLMGASVESKYKDRIDIKLDHHTTRENFAAVNYANEKASATGEIIYEILKENNRLNKKSAEAIYAAIASDCGCFRYANTTRKTHLIAADLFEIGIDFKSINSLLFESKAQSEITAQKIAFNSLEYYYDGRLAFVSYTNKEKSENNLTDDDLGAISSLIREIKGVELGVVIKECDGEDGVYKLSARSGETVSCCEVCGLFGGGGHIRASGATVKGKSIAEIKKEIIDFTKDIFAK